MPGRVITRQGTWKLCCAALWQPARQSTASSRCSSPSRLRSGSKTCIRCKAAYSDSSILRSAAPACRTKALSSFGRDLFWETLVKHAVIIGTVARLILLKIAITRDFTARTYTDTALTPVSDDGDMTLDLLTNTTGAQAAVAHLKKVAELTRTAALLHSPDCNRIIQTA